MTTANLAFSGLALSDLQIRYNEINRGKINDVGYSDIEAFAFNSECNVKIPVKFRIFHEIYYKESDNIRALTDEQDIYMLIHASVVKNLWNKFRKLPITEGELL